MEEREICKTDCICHCCSKQIKRNISNENFTDDLERRGEEGERERGRRRGGEKGQDKTDSFHWHGDPDVVQVTE